MEESGPFRYLLEPFTRFDKRFFRTIASFLTVSFLILFSSVNFFSNLLPAPISLYLRLNPGVIGPAINFAVIWICMLWLGRKPLSDGEGITSVVQIACQRFYWSWILVWFSWSIFYGYLLVEELAIANWTIFRDPWVWSAIQNSLNNVQTAFFLLCYFFLAWPIVATARKTQFQPSTIIVPLFAVVATLASFECLAAGFTPHFYPEYASYFEMVSAFSAGIAIALLASRLGSLYIGRATPAISLIFLYALLQTGYSTFRLHPVLREIILMLAVPLKIWMFLFVRWIMTRGRLAFYFHESVILNKQIDQDWGQFQKGVLPGRGDFPVTTIKEK